MKRITTLIFALSVVLLFTACGGGSHWDQGTPEGVMNMVFDAAAKKDFSKLTGLCDPSGGGDGDTKRICESASNPDEFVKAFSKGKIEGTARIEGDNAEVDFLFGEGGTDKETMKLVKNADKWYLYSF